MSSIIENVAHIEIPDEYLLSVCEKVIFPLFKISFQKDLLLKQETNWKNAFYVVSFQGHLPIV